VDSKQTMVGFGGLALIGFHYWFGRQRAAMSTLWHSDPGFQGDGGKSIFTLLVPPTVVGAPDNSPPSSTNGQTDTGTILGNLPFATVPAPPPTHAPTQKPVTLPYGPNVHGVP
jgi:hypothetical protein